MQLYMKQKVFSLRGRFDVYDAGENTLYTVEGKMISIHNKHYVYNKEGEQVAYIYKKPISFLPKFFIELEGHKVYEMKRKFSIGREVSVVEELGWEIRGDFFAHNYVITENGKEIATVHQKWLSWGDTYEMTIEDGVNEVLALSVVLCYDIIHAENAAASSNTSNNDGN